MKNGKRQQLRLEILYEFKTIEESGLFLQKVIQNDFSDEFAKKQGLVCSKSGKDLTCERVIWELEFLLWRIGIAKEDYIKWFKANKKKMKAEKQQ